MGRGLRGPRPEPRPYCGGGTSSDPDFRKRRKNPEANNYNSLLKASSAFVTQDPSAADARLYYSTQ